MQALDDSRPIHDDALLNMFFDKIPDYPARILGTAPPGQALAACSRGIIRTCPAMQMVVVIPYGIDPCPPAGRESVKTFSSGEFDTGDDQVDRRVASPLTVQDRRVGVL